MKGRVLTEDHALMGKFEGKRARGRQNPTSIQFSATR